MLEIGYTLSSEEFGPADLVALAERAEDVGFTFALISDHFHPWIDRQGQSPFVWSVIGAVARATTGLRVGTGVTCPIMRIHPAIVAQAAATSAAMMPGRFFLGLGTGENLNEHVTGECWRPAAVRLDGRRVWSWPPATEQPSHDRPACQMPGHAENRNVPRSSALRRTPAPPTSTAPWLRPAIAIPGWIRFDHA